MKKFVLIAAMGLTLTGCATQQGIITPYGESRYEVTSTAAEKQQSIQKALNTAEYACEKREPTERGYIVEKREVVYSGVIEESEREKAKFARNLFAMLGGFFVPIESSDDYETTLVVRCQ